MQSIEFSIQRAGDSEAAEAFDLIEKYYDEIDVMVRDGRTDLERYLSMNKGGIWLARLNVSTKSETPRDTAAIGCILLRPLTQIRNAGEVKRLYVRQLYRGFGVAKALLLALESYAAAQGMKSLFLDTKAELHAAIRLYERCGYEHCERYNDNPQATVFMRKQLL